MPVIACYILAIAFPFKMKTNFAMGNLETIPILCMIIEFTNRY